MNKVQLAQELSEKVPGVSRAQAEKMLEELTSVITARLVAGEEVSLAGFGAFSARKRKGRIGVNPRNVNEQIEIPSVVVAKFKAGKNLKDALKGKGDKATPAPAPESEEERPMPESLHQKPETPEAPAEEEPREHQM